MAMNAAAGAHLNCGSARRSVEFAGAPIDDHCDTGSAAVTRHVIFYALPEAL